MQTCKLAHLQTRYSRRLFFIPHLTTANTVIAITT